MSNQTDQPIKFWKGTNFWVAAVLAIGGIFVGFPADEARIFVEMLVGTVAGAFLIREKVKGLHPDWIAWIKSPNTWNYLATAVIAIVPAIPAELFQRLRELLDAALIGNWQGIASAVFSLATIIYYIFKKK